MKLPFFLNDMCACLLIISNYVSLIVVSKVQTVEKRPREMMLRREFANAVGYLNQILSEDSHVKFIHWDFHKFAKRFKLLVVWY